MTNKIIIISLIFFIFLYTVCRIAFDDVFVSNLVFGFFITLLNFVMIRRKVKKIFLKTSLASGIGYFFRLILLIVIFGVWFKYYDINVWGLLVGISVLPITIPLTIIIFQRRNTDGAST
ncbi:ATP synthase subunit I [Deferribacter thermophilus]|uniref:ATP synthase subunit I n=1 Tax=Deferribacter thermophilus TaxID=53573 RepID=UPI003C1A158E